VKASRYITHILRLKGASAAWKRFLTNARVLRTKLGPVLFQLPPSFKADPQRLSRFLSIVKHSRGGRLRPVFEFRHPSWFSEETYAILRKANAALCIADSSRYPSGDAATADFAYYRFHGPGELFASKYSDRQLRAWAKRIRFHLDDGLEVFVFFNNDFNGYALENARTLRAILSKG
jgi:uncharacterized protein YecE (DUF72 family)